MASGTASVRSTDAAEACDGAGEQNCCEKGSLVSSTVRPRPATARSEGTFWAPLAILGKARGADVRLDFNWNRKVVGAMGYR
jgi:hypothetical protein